MAAQNIGSMQVQGNLNSTITEVELNTLAMRGVARPWDVSFRSAFKLGAPNPGLIKGSGSLADVVNLSPWNMNSTDPSTIVAVRRIELVVYVGGGALNATGAMRADLFRNNQAAGGGAGGKLRAAGAAGLGNFQASNITVGSTVPIAGLDPNPIASIFAPITSTAIGTQVFGSQLGNGVLFEARPGEQPLLFGQSSVDNMVIIVNTINTVLPAGALNYFGGFWTVYYEELEPYYDIRGDLAI